MNNQKTKESDMPSTRLPRIRFFSLALAVLAVLGFSSPARAGDWQWTITPYLWLSSLDIDTKVNDREVLGGESDFGLLSEIDMVFQLHLEGQKGRHGVLFDVTYVDLGGDPTVHDLPGNRSGTVEFKGDFSATLAEVGGIYNPRGDGLGFTLLYGARIIDLDEEIHADFSSPLLTDRTYRSGDTLYDGMLGARWTGKLSEHWMFNLRGDVSAGGTELTWNTLVGIGYSFGTTGRYTAIGGYRYMETEFKERDAHAEVETQATLSGAFVAFAFRL